MTAAFYYQTKARMYRGTLTSNPSSDLRSPVLLESERPPDRPVRRGFWWPPSEATPDTVELPSGWKSIRDARSDNVRSEITGFRDLDDPLAVLDRCRRHQDVFLDLRGTTVPRDVAHTLPVTGWIQSGDRRPVFHKPYRPPVGQTGEDPVFLLIHGFTGEPVNLFELTNRLMERDYAVAVPLLPGHAINPGQARTVGRTGWLRAVEWWAKTLGKNRPVVGVGLSMGGNLVLGHGDLFDALVVMNTPYRIHDSRVNWLPWLKWIKPYYESPESGKITPAEMLIELNRLLTWCRERYPEVETPTLVLNADRDPVVDPSDGKDLVEMLPSATRRVLDCSDHVLTENFRVVDELTEIIVDWLGGLGAAGEPD